VLLDNGFSASAFSALIKGIMNARAGVTIKYPGYPPRAVVPSDKISWDVSYDSYNPTEFTAPHIIERKSDVDLQTIDFKSKNRMSYHGAIRVDASTNRPLNPIGRTGMSGRGRLYR
jgi:hypothetical protein